MLVRVGGQRADIFHLAEIVLHQRDEVVADDLPQHRAADGQNDQKGGRDHHQQHRRKIQRDFVRTDSPFIRPPAAHSGARTV